MSNLPSISFSEAAKTLSYVCHMIDDEDGHIDLDLVLQEQFDDALTNISASIDRRKAFYRELNSKIEMAKSYRDEVTKHIKRYEKIQERFIEKTKQVILANPDIPFKDSFGKRLKVIDTPTPRLVFDQDLSAALNMNLLPLSAIEYATPKTTLVMNNEKLKEDLLAGKELPFAHLEYGKQLRGMK